MRSSVCELERGSRLDKSTDARSSSGKLLGGTLTVSHFSLFIALIVSDMSFLVLSSVCPEYVVNKDSDLWPVTVMVNMAAWYLSGI